MAELARGAVGDRPWGRTLGALGLRGLSGQLTLVAEAKRYRIAFRDGAVVGATSPLASDAAVRIALTGHLVSSTQVADIARHQAASPSRDEIDVIAEHARLTPEQALKLRRRAVAQRAARTFSIERGDFVIEDAISVPVIPGTELDVRTVIYLGARQNLTEQRLGTELGQIGQWFQLKQEAIADLVQFGFTDGERPVLERLVDGADLAELEASAPGIEQRMVRAVVYALLCCNACDVEAVPRNAPPPPARPKPTVPPATRSTRPTMPPADAPPRPVVDAPPRPTPVPQADVPVMRPTPVPQAEPPRPSPSPTSQPTIQKARGAPPSPSSPSITRTSRPPSRPPTGLPAAEDEDELLTLRPEASPTTRHNDGLEGIDDPTVTLRKPKPAAKPSPDRAVAAAEVKKLIAARMLLVDRHTDHFALLGVTPESTPDDVRAAYFKLARQLHPDKLASLGIADEGRRAHLLFAQVNTAFAVLGDPKRRDEYLGILRRGGEAAVRAEEARTEELVIRALDAEEAFRRGEMALRRDQLTTAIAEFKHAMELDPETADYQALHAWAQFCASPDKMAAAQATRVVLERAIVHSPKAVTARVLLGRVERMLGRDQDALRHFQEVLRIAPNHTDATSELRVIEARLAHPVEETTKKGLFSRPKR